MMGTCMECGDENVMRSLPPKMICGRCSERRHLKRRVAKLEKRNEDNAETHEHWRDVTAAANAYVHMLDSGNTVAIARRLSDLKSIVGPMETE